MTNNGFLFLYQELRKGEQVRLIERGARMA
jgi:hypothetical protein